MCVGLCVAEDKVVEEVVVAGAPNSHNFSFLKSVCGQLLWCMKVIYVLWKTLYFLYVCCGRHFIINIYVFWKTLYFRVCVVALYDKDAI